MTTSNLDGPWVGQALQGLHEMAPHLADFVTWFDPGVQKSQAEFASDMTSTGLALFAYLTAGHSTLYPRELKTLQTLFPGAPSTTEAATQYLVAIRDGNRHFLERVPTFVRISSDIALNAPKQPEFDPIRNMPVNLVGLLCLFGFGVLIIDGLTTDSEMSALRGYITTLRNYLANRGLADAITPGSGIKVNINLDSSSPQPFLADSEWQALIRELRDLGVDITGSAVSDSSAHSRASLSGSAVPGAPNSSSSADEAVAARLGELNRLIGLSAVKKDVDTLVNYLRLMKLREAHGIPSQPFSMHLVFTGNPGYLISGSVEAGSVVGYIMVCERAEAH